MARRASTPSAFDLVREGLAVVVERFAALDDPERAARAGRALHQQLAAVGWVHAGSVTHLRAVGLALTRGAGLLLAAEAEQGPWQLVKAHAGFEIAARAVCNHTGESGLSMEMLRRIEEKHPLPDCPELPAPGDDDLPE